MLPSSSCQLRQYIYIYINIGADADELRRYVCARDLHEKARPINIFPNLTDAQEEIVDRLLDRLSPSQQGAFTRVYESKHDIVFLQGPPGTVKTTFIVTLLQILWHCGHSWIACAPSNSATDHLATVLQQACPEMGAIRFHAYENKISAIRRQEQALATEDNTEVKTEDTSGAGTQVETDFTDPQAAEDNRLFCGYMAELQANDLEWKGKRARLNFKHMSLHARAMQNAGLVQYELKCFATTADDLHAEFCRCLGDRDYTREKTDEEKTHYEKLEDGLMADTLRKSGGVITTLSKTADNKLKEGRKEACCRSDRRSLPAHGIGMPFGISTKYRNAEYRGNRR